MKNILFCKKTAVILLAVTILFLALCAYMVARPISYGMEYSAEMVYEGEVFEGTMIFKNDTTFITRNVNYDEDMVARYYYKEGYVFFMVATTDEEYAEEVAEIDEKFDAFIELPFYSYRINAFRLAAGEDDDFSSPYICTSAIVWASVFGGVSLLLIALTGTSFVLSRKKED